MIRDPAEIWREKTACALRWIVLMHCTPLLSDRAIQELKDPTT